MAITFVSFSPTSGTGSAAMRMKPFRMNASAAGGYAQASLEMEPAVLTATGPAVGVARMSMLSMRMIGRDHELAQAVMSLERFTVEATMFEEPIPPYAIGDMSMSQFTMWAYLRTGQSGSASLSMRSMQLQASQGPYGATPIAGASLAPMFMFALDGVPPAVYAFDPRTAVGVFASTTQSLATAGSSSVGQRIFAVTHTEQVTVQEVRTSVLTSHASHTDTMEVVYARLLSTNDFEDDEGTANVWTFNADGYAGSRYIAFPFVSLTQVGGRIFMAGPAGLFELGGETDTGEDIQASAITGRHAYGNQQLKVNTRMLVTGRSDEEHAMELRVITPNGLAYAYPLRLPNGATADVQRVKIGAGHKYQFWQYELRNVFGQDFTVSKMDATPEAVARRVRA